MNDKLPVVKRVRVVETEGFATTLDKARWKRDQKLAERDALNKKHGRKKGGVAK